MVSNRKPTPDRILVQCDVCSYTAKIWQIKSVQKSSSKAAREERLKVSGNPPQYNDLTLFIREQELMRELIAQSMLPSLTLDISDNDIPAAVERVADWLEQTGGLYMPD